jgi:hypothetical protein
MENSSVFSNLGRSRSLRSSSSRSNLFPCGETSVSRLEGSSSTIQTRLFPTECSKSSQEDALECEPSKASSSSSNNNSSLYGLVMQRTTSTTDAFTPKLDKKSKSRTMDPLTPSQRLAKQLASPGGFGLLQMLNTVTSPFVKRRKKRQDAEEEEQVVAAKAKDEWQETELHRVLDWTIHPKVRLECHPPSCLPNAVEGSLDQWNKALQYWQHPATAALSVLVNNFSEATSEVAAIPDKMNAKLKSDGDSAPTKRTVSTATLAKQLMNAVRGPNAYIQQLVRSEEGHDSLRRRRQWQDAFSTLYNTWLNKIDNATDERNADDGSSNATVDASYFYATNSSSQVVLFRAAVLQGEVVPIVALSATTKEMRDKLHARGVTLYMLDGSEPFDEADYETSGGTVEPKDSLANPDDDNKEEESIVHSDMEALRKAQAFGETAGADVTFKATSKRTSLRPVNVPSMYLRGHDDCGAFSTLFLNQSHENGELWCLMSRMGSFPHATMKSLVISKQRVNEENASIEILGPILPCAIPALTGATANSMRCHQLSMDKTANEDESGLGTHYFVLQVQKRGDSEFSRDKNCGLKVTMNSSVVTTGSNTEQQIFEESGMMELRDVCGSGDRFDVVVWDISRPTVATYKLEAAL